MEEVFPEELLEEDAEELSEEASMEDSEVSERFPETSKPDSAASEEVISDMEMAEEDSSGFEEGSLSPILIFILQAARERTIAKIRKAKESFFKVYHLGVFAENKTCRRKILRQALKFTMTREYISYSVGYIL